jgi:hypothetical protein
MHLYFGGHISAVCRDVYIDAASHPQGLIADVVKGTQDILGIGGHGHFFIEEEPLLERPFLIGGFALCMLVYVYPMLAVRAFLQVFGKFIG